jgi:hypothetical protein
MTDKTDQEKHAERNPTIVIGEKGTSTQQLIVVAAITAILTALLTTVVDRTKIAREHARWKKEQLIAYHQSQLNEQTQLVRQVVVSLNHLAHVRHEFNYGFVYLVGARVLSQTGNKSVKVSEIEKQMNEVNAQYLKHWSDVQGQFRHARTLFGKPVEDKLKAFKSYFESDQYKHDASSAASVDALVRDALLRAKQPAWELIRISQQHSKPEGHHAMMRHASELLGAMEGELIETRRMLLNNVLGTVLE